MSSDARSTRTPRRARVVRVAAAAALGVACIGVPLWLIAIGGMPNAHLDPKPLWTAIVGPRTGDTRVVVAWFGRVALVLAWAAWLWILVCVVIELRSWRSGRSPKHLPASHTLQWMAACLVGTAFAMGGAGRAPMQGHPAGAPGAGGRAPVPVIRVLGARAPLLMDDSAPEQSATGTRSVPSTDAGGGPVGAEVTPAGTPQEATAVLCGPATEPEGVPERLGVHVVVGRQTLWSVAELRLGSPRRWKEIAELNYGRFQPDGARLGDDHWISPGWQLVLPPADPLVTADGTGRSESAGGNVRTGGVDRPGAASREETLPRSSDGEPDVTAVVAAGSRVPDATPARRIPTTPVLPLGAGIVGVGVADVVDRLRKVQQRHRGAGTGIRLPDQVLRQFEQRLRVGRGADALRAVEDALVLFHESTRESTHLVRIIGVEVSDAAVHVKLDAPEGREGLDPSVIRAPFSLGPGPFEVSVERERIPGRRSEYPRQARAGFPFPTLVTIGRMGERVVMVHPEGLGSLVISGDRHDAEGVARALALELATSRWSGSVDLVLVGFGAMLERFDRVSAVSSVGPLIADLSWRQLRDSVVLEERGFVSSVEARSTDRGRTWEPIVVICGPNVAADDVRALVDIGRGGRCGIAVIAVGTDGLHGCGPIHQIRAGTDGRTPIVELFGDRLEAQQIDHGDLSHVDDLVRTACLGVPGPAAPPTADHAENEGGGSVETVAALVDRRPATSARVAPPGVIEPDVSAADPGGDVPVPRGRTGRPSGAEVEVAVLGPLEIRGAAREFTRAWARELVVYLAMHPDGASNESWATALWPERVMAPSSLHSTASVARRSLGKALDGTDHLPRSHGRLALASSVGTDWDRFLALADCEDTDRWKEALSLVRGRPLMGLRSTDWSILDGTAPAMESAIVDLSGRLAGACLRAGDPRGAEWSARRGLMVSPYDERLYRMLLRAADAAGNPGGVESVMAELVRIVADEIEPVESVHPSTLTLYRSLSRRRVPVP